MWEFLERPLAFAKSAASSISERVRPFVVSATGCISKVFLFAAEAFGIIESWPHMASFFEHLMEWQVPPTGDIVVIVLALALLCMHLKGAYKELKASLGYKAVRGALQAAILLLGIAGFLVAVVVALTIEEVGVALAIALAVLAFCFIGFVTVLAFCFRFVRKHAPATGTAAMVVPDDGMTGDLREAGSVAHP